MPFEIIEHPKFHKLIKKISKKHRTIHDDLATAKDILSKEPDIMADYIPGFKGKVAKFRMRISGSGIGKSGGCRIIFHKDEATRTIRLLFIYLKSEKENVSRDEINGILEDIELDIDD